MIHMFWVCRLSLHLGRRRYACTCKGYNHCADFFTDGFSASCCCIILYFFFFFLDNTTVGLHCSHFILIFCLFYEQFSLLKNKSINNPQAVRGDNCIRDWYLTQDIQKTNSNKEIQTTPLTDFLGWPTPI